MLYFIRKHFSHTPASQERVLYAFFFVLGAADCKSLETAKQTTGMCLLNFYFIGTHILLTIHHLPSANGASSSSFFTNFALKLLALADPSAWNSLLFGNIIITLILFCFRVAWWVGIGRDTFVASENKGIVTSGKKVQWERKFYIAKVEICTRKPIVLTADSSDMMV